jgi:hypothetical protein
VAFTGKATYSAGATLPEIAEDVSDLVTIASPHETPLLDALGDPARVARSTLHEWLEDELIGNTDELVEVVSSGIWTVGTIGLYRPGDQILVNGTSERVLVTAVDVAQSRITVTRGYGGTTLSSPADESAITLLGNAALEGDDAGSSRTTNRVRKGNYTQIFTSTLEVSGSELAVSQIGVRDEMDHQKANRIRELLRDLENSVINGVAPASNPQGTTTVRRTMRGIRSSIQSNLFAPNVAGFPADTKLTEAALNFALRAIWQRASSRVDLIVVNGREKRRINEFVASNRRFYSSNETFKDMVSVYESDFGTCRVIVSRHVPVGTVLLLDSSRISVLPLAGRSFHHKPLARTGDHDRGEVIGEYTLEFRNESAHGMIDGLTS